MYATVMPVPATTRPLRYGWLTLLLLVLLPSSPAFAQSEEVEALLERVTVQAITRGPDGSIYLAGFTTAPDLPTTEGALQPDLAAEGCGPRPVVVHPGSCADGFLAKLDSTGHQVLFTSYLGGSHFDQVVDLIVDAEGHLYVLGNTQSTDFPTTPTAFQPEFADEFSVTTLTGDLFVAKLSPAADELLYSTYLGGSGIESNGKIQVDAKGAIYVASETQSSDFPVTEGAYLTVPPDPPFADLLGGFFSASTITKIDPRSEELVYSTYFDREIADFAVDRRGSAVLAGPPRVLFFSTTGELPLNAERPAMDELLSVDAFLATLSPDGATVERLTRFGGSETENVADIELGDDGNVWITGSSASDDLPFMNPIIGLIRPQGFIAKLSSDGDVLVASHLPGRGRLLVISETGEVGVLGEALRPNVPTTPDAFLSGPCGTAFAMRLGPNGEMKYSSYLPLESTTLLSFTSSGNLEFLSRLSRKLESFRETDEPPAFACVTHGASREPIDFIAPGPFLLLRGGPVPALSPGTIVDLHGFGWGQQETVPLEFDAQGRVATTLAGIQVLFDGTRGPLLSVQDRLIRAIVPFTLASDRRMTVEIRSQTIEVPPRDAYWAPVSPKIFTLDGVRDDQAAVLNEDGSLNSPENPAPKGSVVAIFATGGGLTGPSSVDGTITSPNGPFPRIQFHVAVSFGTPPFFSSDPLPTAEILYAGAAPGLVAGVIQVNAKIPLDAPSGSNVRTHLRIGDLRVSPFGLFEAPTIAIE